MVSSQRLREESCMRSILFLSCVSAVCFPAIFVLFCVPPPAQAQGGEPQYFAIRGAKVVPVSGPPVQNATIVISRGLITPVGKDIAIPLEAWSIKGKALIFYPALVASFTHLAIPPAPT